MKRFIIYLFGALFFGLLLLCAIPAYAQSTSPPTCGLSGSSAVIVPNATAWAAFTPPAVNSTYTDSAYGSTPCAVKRATNANTDDMSGGETCYYATMECVSADDTKLLVFGANSGNWRVITCCASATTGTEVIAPGSMPSHNGTGLFAWDRTAGNVLWTTLNNVLEKCTITGSSISCVANHTFSEYSGYMVNLLNNTSMTPAGWLPMAGQSTAGGEFDIFMFQPSTGTKNPVYPSTSALGGSCTGDISSAQAGNTCFHGYLPTVTNGAAILWQAGGLVLWDPSTWSIPSYTTLNEGPLTDHEDTGYNLSSLAVGVFEDYQNNPGPWGSCTNSYRPTVANITQGASTPTCLFDNSVEPGWHIGYENNQTYYWPTISMQHQSPPEYFTGNASYAAPSGGNWIAYQNEIMLVRVDANNNANLIYRLALSHTRGYESGGYWADPKAGVSWDGKYVYFSSNSAWISTGCGAVSTCVDIYTIQVQSTASPAPAAPPSNLPAVVGK